MTIWLSSSTPLKDDLYFAPNIWKKAYSNLFAFEFGSTFNQIFHFTLKSKAKIKAEMSIQMPLDLLSSCT